MLPVLHDAREIIRVEAGAANERAVDVVLRHQLGGVRWLHRSAVLDPHRLAGLVPVLAPYGVADRRDGCLRVSSCCRAPGADGPYGFVRDHESAHLGGGYP